MHTSSICCVLTKGQASKTCKHVRDACALVERGAVFALLVTSWTAMVDELGLVLILRVEMVRIQQMDYLPWCQSFGFHGVSSAIRNPHHFI